ncbi:hypothetical protein U1Q18_017520, partial [Sarracenia purpurea var. burkii]
TEKTIPAIQCRRCCVRRSLEVAETLVREDRREALAATKREVEVATAISRDQRKIWSRGAWLLIGGDTNNPRGGEREACLPVVSDEEEDGFPAQHPGKNQRRNCSGDRRRTVNGALIDEQQRRPAEVPKPPE